jgi:hypothetical protein
VRHPTTWIGGFATTAGIVIAVWLLLPLATRGVQLNGNRWVHEGLRLKIDASRARKDEVLLLGGSNVLFGLSARRLEEGHGIHAFNLGQHAGLGRRYILSYGASAVQAGDIVVLSLEYPLWETEKSRDTRNYYVLAHDSAYLYHQRPLDLLEFVAGVRFEEWRTLLAARGHALDHAPPPGYQIANMDGWGDETSNRPDAATPVVKAAALREPMRGPFVLDRRAIRDVRAFGERLSSNGARLVVTFPGVLRRYFAWDDNREFYGELVAQLRAQNIAIAGAPEDSPFDENCLFDSKYHTIHPCTVARTDRLARQLRDLGVLPRALQRH